MKAELMGDNETAQKLKDKLERVKAALAGASAEPAESVVTVSDIDSRGRSRSATVGKALDAMDDDPRANKRGGKKLYKDTHESGERKSYFDDDNMSMKELMERERRVGPNDMDAAFADNISRNAKFSQQSLMPENFDGDDVDYAMWESREKKMSKEKLEKKERARAIAEHKHNEKTTSGALGPSPMSS
jgi:hypothetical protein